MTRIFLPSTGRDAWQALLANPALHWKPGKSAYECASSWEAAAATPRGLPSSIARVLDSHPTTAQAELVLAIPELQVDLPGGGHASQNDLWALLRATSGTISLCLEAKSGETLGPLVSEWLADASPASGKPKRLAFLRGRLGLGEMDVSGLRYQLLHRVSALVQADRVGASAAVLLIQSFGKSSDDKSRGDYASFARAMGCQPAVDSVWPVGRPTALPLLIGWVADAPSATPPL